MEFLKLFKVTKLCIIIIIIKVKDKLILNNLEIIKNLVEWYLMRSLKSLSRLMQSFISMIHFITSLMVLCKLN